VSAWTSSISTTKLNTPGTKLGEIEEVHALTDVTGFGLLGHLLEIAKGSNVGARLDFKSVPLLPGAHEFAREGIVTGASGRNWVGYGKRVKLGTGLGEAEMALLTDPQTSGGLLVACAPSAVDRVLAIFRADGFDRAAVVGDIVEGPSEIAVA